MLKKALLFLLIVLILLPLFYWNQVVGIIILIIEIILVLLYKRQTIFVRIFVIILVCFYSFWIYFNLSGFLVTHYFSIKQLVEKMNETESEVFEIENKHETGKKSEIQEEMIRLGFYYASIDSKHNRITFNIKGTYWTGSESAEKAAVYTDFTFFAGTSYPVSVWIESIDD